MVMLWFVALAGPTAFAFHLNISYVLVPVACGAGSSALLYVTTAVMAAVALTATYLGARALANTSQLSLRDAAAFDVAAGRPGDPSGTGRALLLAVGATLGAFFLLIILLAGIAPTIVGPCSQ